MMAPIDAGPAAAASTAAASLQSSAEGTNTTLAVTIGGSGGTGETGGVVDVDNAGGIETVGDLSPGIYGQSIGALF